MSRKMIDYKVEGNKISTIDGYKVGGDELTGDALMGITKDSTTITRTLDTDGKVKFDTKGDKLTFKTYRVYMTRASADLGGAAANLAAGKGITAKWGVAYAPTSNVEIQNDLNKAKQITLQVAPEMIKIGNGYCLAIPVDEAAYVQELNGNKRVNGWFTLYPIVVDPDVNSSTRFTPNIPLTINIIY